MVSMSLATSIHPTLQSITSIKIRELRKQHEEFESCKKTILDDVEHATDEHSKLRILLSGLTGMQTSNAKNSRDKLHDSDDQEHLENLSLNNIRRFLDHSEYDSSISSPVLKGFEQKLHKYLDQKSQKLDFAHLYSMLLTEWLSSDASSLTAASKPEDDAMDVDYEVVETQKTQLQQLGEKFESVVFTPLEIDVGNIENFLKGLFSDKAAIKPLRTLRDSIKKFGLSFAATLKPFNHEVLRWCIKGLLRNDLLGNQKKSILEDSLQDEAVLTEIGDVLNMRFSNLKSWAWDADGIPVEPREVNGKYRVVMDEDILQSIFLHFISMSWAVQFKENLKDFILNEDVWKRPQSITQEELPTGRYYLGKSRFLDGYGLASEKKKRYQDGFFMCQLPSKLDAGEESYDEDDGKSPSDIKQRLLQTLAAEFVVARSLHGEFAVVQSDLQWFGTSISHLTITTILKFFRVPQIWASFFVRYLEAPLRMVKLDGSSAEVRTRKRGVPIGHGFQKLFEELIIFTMDFAVNKEAELLLYRLHDDLWLVGEPEKCVTAWKTMQECAQTLGVEFNQCKTGSIFFSESAIDDQISAALPIGKVILGFLELDAKTGDWIIDQNQVDLHIKQLQTQLAGCKSVYSWVQTWNSSIGRFLSHTFGQPANCLGRSHVDMILDTHRKVQQALFKNSSVAGDNVTEHLKSLITERFGVTDIPDAFLYFPEELGGLGLRNPFISCLLIREQFENTPHKRMERYFAIEANQYQSDKKRFDDFGEEQFMEWRMEEAFPSNVYVDNRYVSAARPDDPRIQS